MIYIKTNSQKKPKYWGSNNWNLIQNSQTPIKIVPFHKYKRIIDLKVTPLLKKMKTTNKNIKVIFYGNTSKKKTLEETCVEHFKEINFEFLLLVTPQQNDMIEW